MRKRYEHRFVIEPIEDGMEIIHIPTGKIIEFSMIESTDNTKILKIYVDKELIFRDVYYSYFDTPQGLRYLGGVIRSHIEPDVDENNSDEYEQLKDNIRVRLSQIDDTEEIDEIKDIVKKLMLEVLHTDKSKFSHCPKDIFEHNIYLVNEELDFESLIDLCGLATQLSTLLQLKKKEV